jgi:hypothetical protein
MAVMAVMASLKPLPPILHGKNLLKKRSLVALSLSQVIKNSCSPTSEVESADLRISAISRYLPIAFAWISCERAYRSNTLF